MWILTNSLVLIDLRSSYLEVQIIIAHTQVIAVINYSPRSNIQIRELKLYIYTFVFIIYL